MNCLPLEQYLQIFDASKLEIYKSYLCPASEWPKNRSAVAMDMGGTNFRIARVNFDGEGNPNITEFKKMPMPGADKEISADEFFEFFDSMKKEYHADTVGLCFSYRAEILSKNSARIIGFSKGVKIKDAEGRILNARVLNDTTAALLGTKNANMGLILGTGMNICCIADGMILNTEAGRFKNFPREEFDFGELAEMQVGGAYLNPLIEKCEREGLANKDELYDRGAGIIAAEIAGISNAYGISQIRIAAEGSVFYNVHELRSRIIANLDALRLDYEILDGRDKTLIGAALAALL